MTKIVKTSAPVSGSSIAIGSAISGSTAGSILFVGASNDLQQDNSNFFYNNTTKQVYVSGSIRTPILIGGTGTTSTITIQPTSGVGATGADIVFQVGNNGATEAMRILNSGNVGIGTNNPLTRIQITASTNDGSIVGGIYNTTKKVIEFSDRGYIFGYAYDSAVINYELGHSGGFYSGYLGLKATGTTKILLSAHDGTYNYINPLNGGLIIGSTTAAGSSKFSVPVAPTASTQYGLVSAGNSAFDGVTGGFFTGGSNGTVFAANISGSADFINCQKAGAGKFKVDNNGTITAQTITVGLGAGAVANNTAVGFEALKVNTTGDINTAFGYQTLKANTTGTQNVSIGVQSMLVNTTGSYNVSIGYLSLVTNTTGNHNVAIGVSSLNKNTTGARNTAIGFEASRSNTTGTDNVSVGYNAMYSITTGYSNVGVGRLSLYAITTGNSNISIGDSALTALTTASQNVAIGGAAMTNSTSGAANVCIGHFSGLSNTTAANNVYVGANSGSNNNGASNVFIGYGSGFGSGTGARANNICIGFQAADNITSGANNNIIIGYDIDAPSASASNQLSLGNILFGYGINGTGATVSTGGLSIGGLGDNSAILRMISTTKGFGLPQMTTAQKNAISTPIAGLMVYDTTLNKACIYTTAWETITSV